MMTPNTTNSTTPSDIYPGGIQTTPHSDSAASTIGPSNQPNIKLKDDQNNQPDIKQIQPTHSPSTSQAPLTTPKPLSAAPLNPIKKVAFDKITIHCEGGDIDITEFVNRYKKPFSKTSPAVAKSKTNQTKSNIHSQPKKRSLVIPKVPIENTAVGQALKTLNLPLRERNPDKVTSTEQFIHQMLNKMTTHIFHHHPQTGRFQRKIFSNLANSLGAGITSLTLNFPIPNETKRFMHNQFFTNPSTEVQEQTHKIQALTTRFESTLKENIDRMLNNIAEHDTERAKEFQTLTSRKSIAKFFSAMKQDQLGAQFAQHYRNARPYHLIERRLASRLAKAFSSASANRAAKRNLENAATTSPNKRPKLS